MSAEEGVIKFDLEFSISGPLEAGVLAELNHWRSVLWRHGLIGQDPARYGGYGFGNVSRRIGPRDPAHRRRGFAISGTQSGALEVLGPEHYAHVRDWDVQRNRVHATGPVKPSSESLTHAMLYDLDADIEVVLHVHSPRIWSCAPRIAIPVTDATVAYGTPAMAREVERLFRETSPGCRWLFAMGGHEDGIVSCGDTEQSAGQALLEALNAC